MITDNASKCHDTAYATATDNASRCRNTTYATATDNIDRRQKLKTRLYSDKKVLIP